MRGWLNEGSTDKPEPEPVRLVIADLPVPMIFWEPPRLTK